MSAKNSRQERQHQSFSKTGNKPGDQRSSFQVDRDRILYSSAFRRLAQVTQVVSTNEGHVFHNRLTHTLKVAQVARRLAEKLLVEQPDLAQRLGGIDPDVVEAAALAHDLGHPPFGHIAEEELDRCARRSGLYDGFEGNAQSFRILTRLGIHRINYHGLNLTRATLNAVLKYPWTRDRVGKETNSKKWRKYGVYELDCEAFEFARALQKDERQTVEASIMDFADDVTYSVHDLEDFYLAGLIPLELLATDTDEFARFVNEWLQDAPYDPIAHAVYKNPQRFQSFLNATYNLGGKYSLGSVEQKAQIQLVSSQLIQIYVNSVELDSQYGKDGYLQRDPAKEEELSFLQQIVWSYMINNARLAIQKYGQRKIISTLFAVYAEAVEERQLSLIPARFVKDYSELSKREDRGEDVTLEKKRMVVDIVAGFSEAEAVLMYRKLTGVSQGSVMDYVR
ncbi:MAG: deoxyguanosinetriphosphate triphosphohydrolase family protein [Cyanophyceae cyanobacterium]